MTRFLIIALALGLTVSDARAGPRKKETRTFDIGAIVRAYDEPPFAILGPLGGAGEEGWADDGESQFLDGDDVVLLVDGSAVFGNGHRVWRVGERLSVNADAEDLPGISDLVAGLWRTATRRVSADVRLLELPVAAGAKILADPRFAALAEGVLDAGTAGSLARAILAAGGRSLDANLVSHPARRASVGAVHARSYVRDHTVEIAGGTAVGDPLVGWIREGWQVDVRPHVMAGGGVFLEVMLQVVAAELPIREVDLEADDLGRVELPSVSRRVLFSSGRVGPGKSMALLSGNDEALQVLLIRPRVIGRPTATFVPTSAFTGVPVGCAMIWREEDHENASLPPVDPTYAPILRPPRPKTRELSHRGTARLELRNEVALRIGRKDPGPWLAAGDGVLVAADPTMLAGARTLLREKEGQELRTIPIHLRVSSGGSEILTARLLAVPGREICVSDGSLHAYVGDWAVEVAHDAARIGDPEIAWTWGGVALTLRLDAAPVAGVHAVRLTGEVVRLDGEIETKRTGNTVTGIIEAPSGRSYTVNAEAVLTEGEPQTFRPASDLTIEITAGR